MVDINNPDEFSTLAPGVQRAIKRSQQGLMDEESQEMFDAIVHKAPHEITSVEARFLFGRRSYLQEYEMDRFADVLNRAEDEITQEKLGKGESVAQRGEIVTPTITPAEEKIAKKKLLDECKSRGLAYSNAMTSKQLQVLIDNADRENLAKAEQAELEAVARERAKAKADAESQDGHKAGFSKLDENGERLKN